MYSICVIQNELIFFNKIFYNASLLATPGSRGFNADTKYKINI